MDRIYTKIVIGGITYNANRIQLETHSMQFDRINATLPYNYFSFTLFNVTTPPHEGDEVAFYRGSQTTPVFIYTLGLPEQRGTSVYHCTAYSDIKKFNAGTYKIASESLCDGHYYDHAAFEDVIDDIIGTDAQYTIDNDIDETVTGFLPWQSKRTALQEVLLATGVCVFNENGGLHFRHAPTSLKTIPKSRIFMGAKVEPQTLLNQIDYTLFTFTTIPKSSIDTVTEYIESPKGTYYKVERATLSATIGEPLGASTQPLSLGESMLITSENISGVLTRIAAAYGNTTEASLKVGKYTHTNTPIGYNAYADIGYKQVKGVISKIDVHYGVHFDAADIIISDAEYSGDIDLITVTVQYYSDDSVLDYREFYTRDMITPTNSTVTIEVEQQYDDIIRSGQFNTVEKRIFYVQHDMQTEITVDVGTVDTDIPVEYDVYVAWDRTTQPAKAYYFGAVSTDDFVYEPGVYSPGKLILS